MIYRENHTNQGEPEQRIMIPLIYFFPKIHIVMIQYVLSAGFMAKSEDECIQLAKETAMPTHDHPEGIKGAVATALAIHYCIGKKFAYCRNFAYFCNQKIAL